MTCRPVRYCGKRWFSGRYPTRSKRGFVADGAIENHSLGAGWPDDGDHDFDERAFARAVGAEEAENLAAIDLHGNALQGVDAAAIDLGDVLKIDGVAGGGWGHGWVGILPQWAGFADITTAGRKRRG